MTNAAETNDQGSGLKVAPAATPPTFATMLDELDRVIEDACTACRETREKVLPGKSTLQPPSRHTGDPNFIPPILSALDRLIVMRDRLAMLGAELGEMARSF